MSTTGSWCRKRSSTGTRCARATSSYSPTRRATTVRGQAGSDLVKRVIALPGQTIYSAGGILYIDGRRLGEPYLPPHDPLGPPIPGATRQDPFHVPRGEFYVMGDNRAISCDSRFWGPIKGSSIIGRVVMVLWHDSHPDFHFF